MATDLQDVLDRQRRAVDTDFFDLSLREIVRMVEDGELIVRPEYQRQFRWKEKTQSELVESFLLGLPIPPIFVAANTNATWEVVDGLQRVSTIVRFMGSDSARQMMSENDEPQSLTLSDLDTLGAFSGLTFDAMPRTIQFLLEKRFVRVQVLNDKSDPEVRWELFRRLNAGAIQLTAQEVRACVYRGPFNSMIEGLAEEGEFQSLLKLKKGDRINGTSAEVVLKYFAYRDRESLFDGRVSEFLNDYIRSRQSDADLEADRTEFMQSCAHLGEALGGVPFLRPKTRVTPLNQFEAVLVGIGNLVRADRPVGTPPPNWLTDRELLKHSTGGTNSRAALQGRLRRAEALFEAS